MTFEAIRSIFAWCSLINLGLLIWWFLFFVLARDWMFRFHGRWFRISEEKFDAIHYSGMALWVPLKIRIFDVVTRTRRTENRSLCSINEDSSTTLTQLTRKKAIFRGAHYTR